MATKTSKSIRCLTTDQPNAPFLNGVRMQDQECETQADADALVATGLFEYASDAKKAEIEKVAQAKKDRANQKAADQANDEAEATRIDAEAAVKVAAAADSRSKATAATAKKKGR